MSSRFSRIWFLSMSAICVSAWAQKVIQVEVGKTVVVEIPVQTQVTCNVDVYLGGQKTSVEVEANQKTAQFPYQGVRVGEEAIKWEGATKFRGLKTLFGCQGSGVVTVRTVEDQAQLKAEAAMAEVRRLQQELAQRDRQGTTKTEVDKFEQAKQADIAALDAQLRALESPRTSPSGRIPPAATGVREPIAQQQPSANENQGVRAMPQSGQYGQPQRSSSGKMATTAEMAMQLNAAQAFSLSKTRGAYFLGQNVTLIGQGDPSGQKLQAIMFGMHKAWLHSSNNWSTYSVLSSQGSAPSNVINAYEKISSEQKRQAMAYAKEFYETWSAMPDEYKASFLPGGTKSVQIVVDNTFVNEQFVVKILLDESGAISEILGSPPGGLGDSVALLAAPYSKPSQRRN